MTCPGARSGVKRTKTMVIVSLSLILFICSSFAIEPVGSSEADIPSWFEGDNWSYERGEGDQNTRYTMEVVSENQKIDINEEIVKCYEVSYSWKSNGEDGEETHYYDMDNLSLTAEMTTIGTFAYDPSPDRFNFPLKEGKTWSSTAVRWEKPKGGGGEWEEVARFQFDFRVEEKKSVKVPAGKFMTYLVNMSEEEGVYGEDYVHFYYSPDVKNIVKKEEYLYGELVNTERLMDFQIKDENKSPSIGTGVTILTVSSASLIFFYSKKKKRI
ncbi:MAG: hypothetical protein R6U61_06240 [Thermoplasmata archaeon]